MTPEHRPGSMRGSLLRTRRHVSHGRGVRWSLHDGRRHFWARSRLRGIAGERQPPNKKAGDKSGPEFHGFSIGVVIGHRHDVATSLTTVS